MSTPAVLSVGTSGPVDVGVNGILGLEMLSQAHAKLAAGTVTNSGTIRTRSVGIPAEHVISAVLVNQAGATLDVGAPTRLGSISAVSTNAGTITIGAAGGLTIASGTSFTHSGGTIANNGFFRVEALNTFTQGAGTTSGNPIQIRSSILTLSGTGASSFETFGTVQLKGNIAATQTLRVLADGSGFSELTAAASFTNAGTLELGSTASNTAALTFQSLLGGGLANTGTIRTLPGAGGARQIHGNVGNQVGATLDLRAPTELAKSGSSLSNAGTITIAAAGGLTIFGTTGTAGGFTDFGGTITNNGFFRMNGGNTFAQGAGTTSGNAIEILGCPARTSCATRLTFSGTGASSFKTFGSVLLDTPSGGIAATQTVRVLGDGGVTGTLEPLGSFTNAGTLELSSTDTLSSTSASAAKLSMVPGTVTNTGTIRTAGVLFGAREMKSVLINHAGGTLDIRVPTKLGGVPGVSVNSGTISVGAFGGLTIFGHSFTHSGGTITNNGFFRVEAFSTFTQSAGTSSGNPIQIRNSTLTFGGAAASSFETFGSSTLNFAGGTLNAIAATQTVKVVGDSGGDASLAATTSFINAGTLELRSRNSTPPSAARLFLGAGTVLTNTGTIRSSKVDDLFGVSERRVSGNVASSGVLSPEGILHVDGTYSQTGSGTLNIDIAGTSAAPALGSGYDRLAVAGAASLAGSLNITTASSFSPTVGQVFTILTCNSCSGTFGTVTGTSLPNGSSYSVTYSPTSVTLTVTASDTVAPTLTAPTNLTVGTNVGCTYVGAIGTATATDNVSSGAALVITNNAPTSFPLGTTTVTWTATDAAGNSATATQQVTVVDDDPPSITPPAALSVGTNVGATYVGPIGTATASDNCSSGAALVVTNNAPAAFPLGPTTVTWTATDAAGNSTPATQLVTVFDDDPPTIAAPANQTVSTDPGQCSALVSYGPPTATDNVGVISIVSSPPSGRTFPKGTTTVTHTATDAAGNSASATHTVTVNDTQPPSISVPANITVGTDPGQSSAVVSYSVTASDNCPGVSVTASPASGSAFPVGTTSVTGTATDASGNTASATFTITVEDREPPSITAPANQTVSADPGQCSALVSYGPPTATDNVGVISIVSSPPSASTFPKGTTTVTHTASDAAGNTATATHTVTVNDTQPPAITAPANITVGTDPGRATAVVAFAFTASDNCPGVTVVASPPSGSAFSVGTTTVTGTATDASGNTARASFTITVEDREPPTITCPGNVTVFARVGELTAPVTYAQPTATDNVGVAAITSTPPSGSVFPAGTTTVTATAVDAAGNSATCSFTVAVNLSLAIDIKPGSFPNSVNPGSRGTIPVAILAVGVFDPLTLDRQSLRFGPTGSEASPLRCAAEDVNGDGRMDVVCHFETLAAAFHAGDTSGTISGRTSADVSTSGSDSVRIAPPE